MFVDYALGAVVSKRGGAEAGMVSSSPAKRAHRDGAGDGSGGGVTDDVDSEDEMLYATADVRGNNVGLDELSGRASGHGEDAGGLRLRLLDVLPAVTPIVDMCAGVAPKTEFEEDEVRHCGSRRCSKLVCAVDGFCSSYS